MRSEHPFNLVPPLEGACPSDYGKRRAYPLQQALHMRLTAVWVCLILCKADERLTATSALGPFRTQELGTARLIAAMIAVWTFLSCAATAAASDERR